MKRRKRAIAGVIVLFAFAMGYWAYRAWWPAIMPPPVVDEVPAPGLSVRYSCDGGKVVVANYVELGAPEPTVPATEPRPTGSVNVSLDGGHVETLWQTVSADGVRYANADESLVFWSKGDSALVLRNNAMDPAYANCKSTTGQVVVPDGATGTPAAGPITVTGTTLCLPHRDLSGPQTEECAFGLKDDAGRYFALLYNDPIGVPADGRVEVTGTFAPRVNSRYQDVGVITVSRIEAR